MTTETQLQTEQPEQTAPAIPYVARRPLRFGVTLIQPGEPVPVESGRNYSAMLSRGEIALAFTAGAVAQAPAPLPLTVTQESEGPTHSLTIPAGPAYFITEDGLPFPVMVLSFRAADAEDADVLEVDIGTPVAEVSFDGDEPDEEPSAVLVSGLLPVSPVDRLAHQFTLSAQRLEELEGQSGGQGSAEHAQADAEALSNATAELEDLRDKLRLAQAERDFALLCIRAATAEGDALPDEIPSRAALVKSHIKTVPGLLILLSAPDPVGSLAALDGIAVKSARKILEYLARAGLFPQAQTEAPAAGKAAEGEGQAPQATPEGSDAPKTEAGSPQEAQQGPAQD